MIQSFKTRIISNSYCINLYFQLEDDCSKKSDKKLPFRIYFRKEK